MPDAPKKTTLNTSKFKGSVWINMRAERLGTFLSHVRKVSKGTGDQSLCVNLTGLEYSMVQETLKKVQHHDPQLSDKGNTLKKDQGAALKKVKHDDPQPSDKKSQVPLKKDQGAATLKKVTTKTLTKDAATLKKDLPERKKLKKTLSDVSVDSWGIPKELASPSKTSETSPPRIWKRKRVGGNRSTVPEDEGHPKLQEAMGFKKAAASLKKEKGTRKPATSSSLKREKGARKPATSSSLKKEKGARKPATSSSLKKDHTLKKGERKPWKKISKTIAKNPARSYLVGAHQKLDKAKLIVEVSQKKR